MLTPTNQRVMDPSATLLLTTLVRHQSLPSKLMQICEWEHHTTSKSFLQFPKYMIHWNQSITIPATVTCLPCSYHPVQAAGTQNRVIFDVRECGSKP